LEADPSLKTLYGEPAPIAFTESASHDPFFTWKNYRAGLRLFSIALLPTLMAGIGLALIRNREIRSLLFGIPLISGGFFLLSFLLRRFGPVIAQNEWQIKASPSPALPLFWRLMALDLAFWVGNGFFPYHRVTSDIFIFLLFLINMSLLVHLVPATYGFALRNTLARNQLAAPTSIPFDLAMFGLFLVMEGPVDFSIMVRNPEYSIALFGRVFPGEMGTIITWAWPFLHIVLGYAVFTRQRWVFYFFLVGGVYALISAAFNYYTYGFGIIRTIFVTLIPILMGYLWWRRKYFLAPGSRPGEVPSR
jgi:hypothetical protein